MKRKHIIIALIAVIALIFTFRMGGDAPQTDAPSKTGVTQKSSEIAKKSGPETAPDEVKTSSETKAETEPQTPKAEIAESENVPEPQKPTESAEDEKELTCTLSVTCTEILGKTSGLAPEKAALIPSDGVIFAEREVRCNEGESVFNVLLREMKKNKIHMEFVKTPVYKSAYVEGIANIYEFDFGEQSGWIYKVNGEVPSYGCSRYKLKKGDKIEWVYTCNLGADAGGGLQKDE